MSKLDDAIKKYPRIKTTVIQAFYDDDPTKTKKYFDFMVAAYSTRNWYYTSENAKYYGYDMITKPKLIKLILRFNSLLPYLENKDIYSDHYRTLRNLENAVENAADAKSDSEFTREGNIDVISETDSYIMLRPLTVQGSAKYGKGTRWCTVSGSFSSYNNGTLVYLIDKKNEKNEQYKKVAFYIDVPKGGGTLMHQIYAYNTVDTRIDFSNIVKGGWDEQLLFDLILRYQIYVHKTQRVMKVRDDVKRTISMIKNIDLNELYTKVDYVNKNTTQNVFGDELVSTITEFNEKVKVLSNMLTIEE